MHHHPQHPPDTRTQLFVSNLPFRVRWQDLVRPLSTLLLRVEKADGWTFAASRKTS